MAKVRETEIQAAICDYLALRKVFFWRQNNSPASTELRAFSIASQAHPRGIPDIIAVKDGRSLFLEVKAEKGRLFPDQEEFGRRAMDAGASYHVVRSIEDVQQIGL